ncbi:hypothetical protein RCL_jg9267.t1 [Rhizophagus clarus]|uniref:Uncharacterized protein n=1 Tax=Rhizophagus clarus TaxID=94130 RepID=A0A8H3M7G7_9GLOM|nr:hypothetical protein RCL_jg9267.t1 [Rhizophagus clarus]
MAIIQRPDYPIYSLSLTAAVVYLIYKYIYDYDYEFLMDTLILEKFNEVIYFVKNCWNFNSDIFTLSTIFVSIIHTICIIWIVRYALISPIMVLGHTVYLFKELLKAYKRQDTSYRRKFFYFVSLLLYIIFLPLFLPLLLAVSIPVCVTGFYLEVVVFKLIDEIIELYKYNNGFWNVMDIFLIIIYTFLNIGYDNYFIYVVCRINLTFKYDTIYVVYRIFKNINVM